MEYSRSYEDALSADKKIVKVLKRAAGPVQIEYLANSVGERSPYEIISHLRSLQDEGVVEIYSDMVFLLRA